MVHLTLRPIRQNQVRNPGDMIAFADAPLEVVSDYPGPLPPDIDTSGQLVGRLDLSYGLIWHPIALEVRGQPLGTGGDEPWASKCRMAMRKRHTGRWNVVFCDGHVENLKTRELYGMGLNSLRRWNNDNLPHKP